MPHEAPENVRPIAHDYRVRIFACQPLVYQQVSLTAPFVKPAAALDPQQTETGPEAARFAAHMKKSSGVFPVSQLLLAKYAAKLVEVSRFVKESAYDIVLCPMRGARLAGLEVDLICSTEPVLAFDGSDMGKGMNVERILSDLRTLIYERSPASDVRKIGVLDTAVGGDSCREFARLLGRLNERKKEKWSVRFHLIHPEGRIPPKGMFAKGMPNKPWVPACQSCNGGASLDDEYMQRLSMLWGADACRDVPGNTTFIERIKRLNGTSKPHAMKQRHHVLL